MPKNNRIYCCGCSDHVEARLTNGREIYPHRKDLLQIPFWKCDTCGNSVGCHHKTANPTQPLGCIPTPSLKMVRMATHEIIDPIWKSGRIKRAELYTKIAKGMGINKYHTAQIRSLAEANKVLDIARKIASGES